MESAGKMDWYEECVLVRKHADALAETCRQLLGVLNRPSVKNELTGNNNSIINDARKTLMDFDNFRK